MPPGQADATRQPVAITPLGGVRADFVANLGRRMTELRQHWTAFEQEPGTARYRDEVRRRVHALATRARLLEFPVMADPLEEAERRLDRLAEASTIAPEEIGWFHDLFRNLPSMAWTEAGAETPASLALPDYHRSVAPPAPPPSSAAPAPSPLPAAPPVPSRAPSQTPADAARAPSQIPAPLLSPGTLASILVVGSDKTARALLEGHGSASVSLEAERTDDVSVALDLARALAPDLVVIDFDVDGAGALVTALSEDPLTEGLPVIAIGSWTHPDQGADLLHLGLVRALPKPVPPDTLRAAAELAISQGRGIHPPLEPLGEMTVEQVADRLASQLRSGLVQAVRPESRRVKIPLGDGTDALAAVWGAVARLRETLTIRSKGEVRFSSDGPAGAVPLASWLDDGVEAPPRRRDGSSSREAERVRLEGRKIVVVDDDPAVTWFLSGLLRNAGAFVYEAHDGRRAFEIACRAQPDLVVSDIVMPELDGFGLCRVLKRDIALRDTPVILLSWKEDMLQRVRELGARADGYLRKESPVPAILRRVHEVLLPRLRIETRLRGSGEVRGRLDGLTGKTLLQLVCANAPDCRLELRDALHVFSLDVRGGSPVTASRTKHDGSFERGHPALVALLGLTSGRFHVRDCSDAVRPNLQGDLASILLPFIARARAAQALLSAERLADVLSVQLSDALPLESMPDSARTVLAALRQGASPFDLVAVHRTPATVVEAVLDDAAIRGAIDRILDVSGNELLEAETARQIDLLKTTDKRVSRAPSAASSVRSAARAAPLPPSAP
ncbi:MAG TPA: response regulator, partial [Polyangiaceae bacterium]|nr:response regulator [Polyangiaceae bacterium]